MNNDQKTITLAQWCAYLPYELRLKCTEIHEDFFTTLTHWQPTMFINGMNIVTAIEYNAKPLLRPMNEDNQRKINDLIRMEDAYFYYDSSRGFGNHSTEGEGITTDYFNYECLPYLVVQVLLGAHYDIFNLIGQDLALPIE